MVGTRKLGAVLAGFAYGALLIGCSSSHGPSGKSEDTPPATMTDPGVVPPSRTQAEPGVTAGAGAADGDEPSTIEPTPTEPPPVNADPEPVDEPRSDCLQAGDGTYAEYGPYRVETMLITTDSPYQQYTVFYPQPFEVGCKHPVAVWGNATGVGGAENYGFLNSNAASWGVVVAAAHTPNAFSPAPFKVGIEWLLAENENPDSIFHGKLSARVGLAGHEQAGLGATSFTHPNVAAVIAVMANANPGIAENVAYACLTGSDDVLSKNLCTKTYETAAGPAFVASWQGANMFTPTSEQYGARNAGTLAVQRLYAAWLRCFLADDEAACKLFRGEPCGICGENGWAQLEGRNL